MSKPNRAERRRLAFKPTLADSEKVDIEKHAEEREKREQKKLALKQAEQYSWVPGPAAAVLTGETDASSSGSKKTKKKSKKEQVEQEQDLAVKKKKKKSAENAAAVDASSTTKKSSEAVQPKQRKSGAMLAALLADDAPSGPAKRKREKDVSEGSGSSAGKKKRSDSEQNGQVPKKSDKKKRQQEQAYQEEETMEDQGTNESAAASGPIVLMQGVEATDDYVFFFKGWPGAWYKARFAVKGESFTSLEQFLCASKARMFGNEEVLRKVMASTNPAEQHSAAKHFKPFDAKVWVEALPELLYIGNLAKFTQISGLKRALLSTGDRKFVECNPRDLHTGIGMPLRNQDRENPTLWKGQNMLGEALVRVRDDIRSGNVEDIAEDDEDDASGSDDNDNSDDEF